MSFAGRAYIYGDRDDDKGRKEKNRKCAVHLIGNENVRALALTESTADRTLPRQAASLVIEWPLWFDNLLVKLFFEKERE